MSNVGDALSGGGSSASGVNDQTFSDASLGDQIMGGDGSFGTGDPSAFAGGGPSEFSQFSDIANALSSGSPVGSSSVGAQTAAMTPPSVATATGGDPAGASGGTQSNTAPGSSPNQNQQQQSGGGGGQPDPDHAPPSAVAELKTLLKGLSGQPTGPTGPVPQGGQAAPFALPTLAAGQTGAQSPRMALPSVAGGQTGPPSPQMPLPGVAAGETGDQSPGSFDGTPVQPQGGPSPASQVAGAPAAEARIAPGAASAPTAAPEGRQITVKKTAQPQPTPDEPQPVPTADLPTRVPHPADKLPTKKPGASPAPAAAPPPGPATSSILNDISGVSTGSPTALADLARRRRSSRRSCR